MPHPVHRDRLPAPPGGHAARTDLTHRREQSVHDTAPITPDPDSTDPDPASDPLLTLPQILGELSVPRSTFYRWRQLGTAPRAIRLPGGQLRFRRTDLDA